jgi:hypothetical protein
MKFPRSLIPAFCAVAIVGCKASGEEDPPPTPPPPVVIPNAPNVTLDLTPDTVPVGGAATLKWTASDATSCNASGAWGGAQLASNTSGTSTGPISTPGVYVYGITCVGPGGGGSAVQQLTVGNPPAPIVNLTITPLTMRPGDTATIMWSSSNATSCVGSDGAIAANWAGSQVTSNVAGFRVGPVATAGEYAFTMTCAGVGGSSSATRILTVDASAPAAPPDVTLRATPGQIEPGRSISLDWSTANAASCNATGGATGDGAFSGLEAGWGASSSRRVASSASAVISARLLTTASHCSPCR